LTSIHPNALATAAASEAAANQDKFWEMHDLLFARQDQWESVDASARNALLEDYATELELDLEQYKTDLASEEVSQKINFQRSLGSQAGVSATPILFLNGKKLDSSVTNNLSSGDGSEIRKLIDEALKN